MPIKAIVNSFYRSGSTFLWEYLKNNACRKNGLVCFYEPDNPDLGRLINQEGMTNNILHGKQLWQEYLCLPEEKRDMIFRNNPLKRNHLFILDKELKSYFDIYDSLDDYILLQTNLMSFHLKFLTNLYKTKTVHIVRNPISVKHSVKNAYFVSNNKIARILKKTILYPTLYRSMWLYKIYDYIYRSYGYPKNIENKIFKKKITKYNFTEIFAITWTISNYMAIKDTRDIGGLILNYEEFGRSQRTLSQHLGISLTKEPDFKPRPPKNNDQEFQKFMYYINKFELNEEYELIREYLENHK
ncbi:sulfotransferase family protein [Desulfovermiculus halophilus]|uniref:sulfotransferase family protein n=1 Tax=Desulfovermiculus halophilus TaxID=339722 RepID=UPI000480FA1A|nr:sulfotransferase family protein [Desulfovermiculus halophilus]